MANGGEAVAHRQDEQYYSEKLLHRRLIMELQKLSRDLEKFNLAEYMELLNNPRRYLLVNFAGGSPGDWA